MFKNAILTTFSLASIFGMNLILNGNSIELDERVKDGYKIDNINSSKDLNFYQKEEKDIDTDILKYQNRYISKVSSIEAHIRQLMNEADSFADKERYIEAIKKYNEVIKLTEKSKDINILKTFAGANYLKAYLYFYYLEDDREAILAYDRVVDKFKDSQDIELLKLYFKAQKYKLQLIDNPKDKMDIYQDISDRFEDSTDTELVEMYIFAQKSMAQNMKSLKGMVDIYNSIIEKTKYSDSKKLLKEQIEAQESKIDIFSIQNRTEDIIDVYDEIINSFKDDDRFYSDVSSAMLMKSYYITSIDKTQALDILDELIDREMEESNQETSINFEYSVINALELAIITDIDESRYEDILKENFQDRADIMAEYDMLKILQNAQYSNQDMALKDWENRYGDYKFSDWDFENLDEWSSSFENPDTKQRVSKYLSYFESRT